MRWLRNPVLWVAAAAVALGLLIARGRRPPSLPADPDHSTAQQEVRCLGCHSHEARRARPPNHPLRDDCFSCHPDRSGALHPRPGAPTSLPGGWRDDPRLAGRTAPGRNPADAPAGR